MGVSILGMLEGVLKGKKWHFCHLFLPVSILGMLEGVLKARSQAIPTGQVRGFNPWYVGGGVKRPRPGVGAFLCLQFQSLVCWRGC